jgi:hypothetical protein
MGHPVIHAALLAFGLVAAIASAAGLLFFVTEFLERRIDAPPHPATTTRKSDESATLV